ncbi:uncharacterized protein LOC110990704 [Acanthaster planci]|uniref:Uncharacterized protein LOC110990704 n=1 Tax=Acanthaster planci TaxID=133434 RepID=A0A8B8A2A2_ACAPL|nr:uncharacterized protein LOC110990704 [Acanthaster planci]
MYMYKEGKNYSSSSVGVDWKGNRESAPGVLHLIRWTILLRLLSLDGASGWDGKMGTNAHEILLDCEPVIGEDQVSSLQMVVETTLPSYMYISSAFSRRGEFNLSQSKRTFEKNGCKRSSFFDLKVYSLRMPGYVSLRYRWKG